MEYEEYQVSKEEKLEDLALKFKLTTGELLHLNPNLKTFTNFFGTQRYVEVLQIIKIPKQEKIIEKKFTDFLADKKEEKIDFDFEKIYNQQKQEQQQARSIDFEWKENNQFKIDISTSLYVLGKSLGENSTSSIWNVQSDTENILQIDVLSKKNIKIDGQLKPLIEIVDKINKTTESLKLKLNENRNFAKVLDTDTISKKWEHIKFNTLKHLEMEDEYFKEIIKSYDKEFKNLSNSISLNVLYQIFLYPQALVKYPVRNSHFIGEKIRTISQLLPGQFIDYDLYYTSKEEDDKIIVNCTSSEPEKWDKSKIKNEYEKNYASLIQEKFDYKFRLEAQYIYNTDHTLQSIKAYVKEQANKDLFYISEYTFTSIDNTEIEKI